MAQNTELRTFLKMLVAVKGSVTHNFRLGDTKILQHAQFLCQFYELRKLNMHTGYGFVAWFGQYAAIAFLVPLFGFTQPITYLDLFQTQKNYDTIDAPKVKVQSVTEAHSTPSKMVHKLSSGGCMTASPTLDQCTQLTNRRRITIHRYCGCL